MKEDFCPNTVEDSRHVTVHQSVRGRHHTACTSSHLYGATGGRDGEDVLLRNVSTIADFHKHVFHSLSKREDAR